MNLQRHFVNYRKILFYSKCGVDNCLILAYRQFSSYTDNQIFEDFQKYQLLDEKSKRQKLKNILKKVSEEHARSTAPTVNNVNVNQNTDQIVNWAQRGIKEDELCFLEEDESDDVNTTHETSLQFDTLLNCGRPLNIFRQSKGDDGYDQFAFWKAFDDYQKDQFKTNIHMNQWEEDIKLTNEGKLWHFPIDNEQGSDPVALKESFDEHLLLKEKEEIEKDEWIAKNPALHELFNLIVLGLSRNHFLTANEKRDHLKWYINYLKSKSDIFDEIRS